MTTTSILWFLAIGVVVYFMMKKGGGGCCGHDHGGHGQEGSAPHGGHDAELSADDQGAHGESARLDVEARPGKDPVCGMDVNENASAPTRTYLGKTVLFCSDRCQKLFDLNPGKYMGQSHETHQP